MLRMWWRPWKRRKIKSLELFLKFTFRLLTFPTVSSVFGLTTPPLGDWSLPDKPPVSGLVASSSSLYIVIARLFGFCAWKCMSLCGWARFSSRGGRPLMSSRWYCGVFSLPHRGRCTGDCSVAVELLGGLSWTVDSGLCKCVCGMILVGDFVLLLSWGFFVCNNSEEAGRLRKANKQAKYLGK